MALRIDINGTIVPNAGFYQMADWVIYTSEQSYPKEIVTLTNTGTNSFSITGVAKASWARNIDVSGIPIPTTLNPGASVTGVLRVTRRGPLDEGTFFPGCPFGQTIFYTTTGTFTVEHAAKMKRDTSTSGYVFPSTGDFARYWVLDGWPMCTATPTNANPLAFGWNIMQSGYYRFALDYLSYPLNAGHRGILIWQPWGATHNINPNDPSDIQFDAYIHAQEYGAASGNNNPWIEWTRCLDYIYGYSGVEVYVYNGTMRADPDYINLINSGTPAQFISRTMRAVQHLFKYNNLHLCLDAHSNLAVTGATNRLCQPTEPRFEFLNLCRKLLARRGGRTYLEPRPDAREPYFFGSSGWCHIMTDAAYIRGNPAWYADASGSATDAQCSGIIRWITNGSTTLYPYQIADTLMYNQQCILSLGEYWYRSGGKTLAELYTSVKDLVDYCNGAVIT